MLANRIFLTAVLGFAWSLHDHSERFAGLSAQVLNTIKCDIEEVGRVQRRVLDLGWWLQDVSEWFAEQGLKLEGWLAKPIENSGFTIEEIVGPLARA